MKGVATTSKGGNHTMDFLGLITDTAWITAISTLFGSIIGYFASRSNNKKELAINDRMQLSKDQYQLIAELRQMMLEQREEIDGLRGEIKQLQAVNINLTIENKQLQTKIAELNTKLEDFKK
jgi:predicted RNase H-like nuclease (RuvC/YqgF family)